MGSPPLVSARFPAVKDGAEPQREPGSCHPIQLKAYHFVVRDPDTGAIGRLPQKTSKERQEEWQREHHSEFLSAQEPGNARAAWAEEATLQPFSMNIWVLLRTKNFHSSYWSKGVEKLCPRPESPQCWSFHLLYLDGAEHV